MGTILQICNHSDCNDMALVWTTESWQDKPLKKIVTCCNFKSEKSK